ncbi:hypothetical protein BD779DRAFT_1494366 [Infundibulicybe gibba]|nr:hypothetical protein BD779DRAFT_1494366 [Infundibulicybe gibba]
MPPASKPITLARINDSILGLFGLLQPSETVDHLVRYLGTWSGSDKLFMVIQYAVKLIVPLLHLRARLQHRVGLKKEPFSRAAAGYAKLGSILGNSRTMWRIWGLLPIVQWLISLERNPQPTRKLLVIERLQGWSMLAYYPLEHFSYLSTSGIIPSTIPTLSSIFSTGKPITLDPDSLGIWSCRFWALYVFLQFAHLREDWKLLQAHKKSLRKVKGSGLASSERELQQRWDSYWNDLVTNIGYLPLTLHWSLKQGLFRNEAWVGSSVSLRCGIIQERVESHRAASSASPGSIYYTRVTTAMGYETG